MKKTIHQMRNVTVLQESHAQDLGDSLAQLTNKPELRHKGRDQKKGKI